jgi:hypothetical protein
MQNGKSIDVRLDKSSEGQIILGNLRERTMAAAGFATAGKWQTELAFVQ